MAEQPSDWTGEAEVLRHSYTIAVVHISMSVGTPVNSYEHLRACKWFIALHR